MTISLERDTLFEASFFVANKDKLCEQAHI